MNLKTKQKGESEENRERDNDDTGMAEGRGTKQAKCNVFSGAAEGRDVNTLTWINVLPLC